MYKLGYYIPQDSVLHRYDPRVKTVAVIIFSLLIMQAGDLGLLGLTALLLVMAKLAKLSWVALLETLRPVLPFFALLFLIYLFFTPGIPVKPFPLGPVQATFSGLHLGILQVGKFALLILAASLLLVTTSSSDLTVGMEHMLRPLRAFGISSHDISLMLTLALRFLPLLLQEMESLHQAQSARGAGINNLRWKRKIRAIGLLAAPLSINILRRGDELVEAMEARGYHPGPRTYLRELVLNRSDYWVLAAILTAGSIFLMSNW